MADTTTANYGLTKPEPGASASTWGAKLNADLDIVDATMKANADAAAAGSSSIGDVKMFAGAAAPANWLFCDGSSLLRSAYPELFAVIGVIYGAVDGTHFSLPNLVAKFPIGAGTGYSVAATGGEASHTLSAAEMPVHTHVINQPSHQHAISDPTHTHSIYDPTHTHSVTPNPHHHGGVIRQTGSPNTGAAGFNFVQAAQLTDDTSLSIAASGTGIALYGAATGINVTDFRTTGDTAQSAGGSATHNNLPPYIAINFVIRAL